MGLKVDGYAVARTIGNGFPKPGKSLGIAENAEAVDDGKPTNVFSWKIRETAPGTAKRAKGGRVRARAQHRERIK